MMTNQPVTPEERILNDIVTEYARQRSLYPDQRHTLNDWYAILGEELGEMAKEFGRSDNWRVEAVQVMAVLLQMIVAHDSNAFIFPHVTTDQYRSASAIRRALTDLETICRLHMQTYYGQS